MIYLVIDQNAVWGYGNSEHEALENAAQWICDDNGNQGISVDEFRGLLVSERDIANGVKGFAVVSYDAELPDNASSMTSYQWINHYYNYK